MAENPFAPKPRSRGAPQSHPVWQGSPSTVKELTFSGTANRHIRNTQAIPTVAEMPPLPGTALSDGPAVQRPHTAAAGGSMASYGALSPQASTASNSAGMGLGASIGVSHAASVAFSTLLLPTRPCTAPAGQTHLPQTEVHSSSTVALGLLRGPERGAGTGVAAAKARAEAELVEALAGDGGGSMSMASWGGGCGGGDMGDSMRGESVWSSGSGGDGGLLPSSTADVEMAAVTVAEQGWVGARDSSCRVLSYSGSANKHIVNAQEWTSYDAAAGAFARGCPLTATPARRRLRRRQQMLERHERERFREGPRARVQERSGAVKLLDAQCTARRRAAAARRQAVRDRAVRAKAEEQARRGAATLARPDTLCLSRDVASAVGNAAAGIGSGAAGAAGSVAPPPVAALRACWMGAPAKASASGAGPSLQSTAARAASAAGLLVSEPMQLQPAVDGALKTVCAVARGAVLQYVFDVPAGCTAEVSLRPLCSHGVVLSAGCEWLHLKWSVDAPLDVMAVACEGAVPADRRDDLVTPMTSSNAEAVVRSMNLEGSLGASSPVHHMSSKNNGSPATPPRSGGGNPVPVKAAAGAAEAARPQGRLSRAQTMVGMCSGGMVAEIAAMQAAVQQSDEAGVGGVAMTAASTVMGGVDGDGNLRKSRLTRRRTRRETKKLAIAAQSPFASAETKKAATCSSRSSFSSAPSHAKRLVRESGATFTSAGGGGGGGGLGNGMRTQPASGEGIPYEFFGGASSALQSLALGRDHAVNGLRVVWRNPMAPEAGTGRRQKRYTVAGVRGRGEMQFKRVVRKNTLAVARATKVDATGAAAAAESARAEVAGGGDARLRGADLTMVATAAAAAARADAAAGSSASNHSTAESPRTSLKFASPQQRARAKQTRTTSRFRVAVLNGNIASVQPHFELAVRLISQRRLPAYQAELTVGESRREMLEKLEETSFEGRRARLMDVYLAIDENHDGTVEPAELLHFARYLCPEAVRSPALKTQLLRHFDPNNDGHVSMSEFLGCFRRLTSGMPDHQFDAVLDAYVRQEEPAREKTAAAAAAEAKAVRSAGVVAADSSGANADTAVDGEPDNVGAAAIDIAQWSRFGDVAMHGAEVVMRAVMLTASTGLHSAGTQGNSYGNIKSLGAVAKPLPVQGSRALEAVRCFTHALASLDALGSGGGGRNSGGSSGSSTGGALSESLKLDLLQDHMTAAVRMALFYKRSMASRAAGDLAGALADAHACVELAKRTGYDRGTLSDAAQRRERARAAEAYLARDVEHRLEAAATAAAARDGGFATAMSMASAGTGAKLGKGEMRLRRISKQAMTLSAIASSSKTTSAGQPLLRQKTVGLYEKKQQRLESKKARLLLQREARVLEERQAGLQAMAVVNGRAPLPASLLHHLASLLVATGDFGGAAEAFSEGLHRNAYAAAGDGSGGGSEGREHVVGHTRVGGIEAGGTYAGGGTWQANTHELFLLVVLQRRVKAARRRREQRTRELKRTGNDSIPPAAATTTSSSSSSPPPSSPSALGSAAAARAAAADASGYGAGEDTDTPAAGVDENDSEASMKAVVCRKGRRTSFQHGVGNGHMAAAEDAVNFALAEIEKDEEEEKVSGALGDLPTLKEDDEGTGAADPRKLGAREVKRPSLSIGSVVSAKRASSRLVRSLRKMSSASLESDRTGNQASDLPSIGAGAQRGAKGAAMDAGSGGHARVTKRRPSTRRSLKLAKSMVSRSRSSAVPSSDGGSGGGSSAAVVARHGEAAAAARREEQRAAAIARAAERRSAEIEAEACVRLAVEVRHEQLRARLRLVCGYRLALALAARTIRLRQAAEAAQRGVFAGDVHLPVAVATGAAAAAKSKARTKVGEKSGDAIHTVDSHATVPHRRRSGDALHATSSAAGCAKRFGHRFSASPAAAKPSLASPVSLSSSLASSSSGGGSSVQTTGKAMGSPGPGTPKQSLRQLHVAASTKSGCTLAPRDGAAARERMRLAAANALPSTHYASMREVILHANMRVAGGSTQGGSGGGGGGGVKSSKAPIATTGVGLSPNTPLHAVASASPQVQGLAKQTSLSWCPAGDTTHRWYWKDPDFGHGNSAHGGSALSALFDNPARPPEGYETLVRRMGCGMGDNKLGCDGSSAVSGSFGASVSPSHLGHSDADQRQRRVQITSLMAVGGETSSSLRAEGGMGLSRTNIMSGIHPPSQSHCVVWCTPERWVHGTTRRPTWLYHLQFDPHLGHPKQVAPRSMRKKQTEKEAAATALAAASSSLDVSPAGGKPLSDASAVALSLGIHANPGSPHFKQNSLQRDFISPKSGKEAHKKLSVADAGAHVQQRLVGRAGSVQDLDRIVRSCLGCGLLASAIASLCHPETGLCPVSQLIDETLEAQYGIYGVSLMVDGRWTMVWLDAYFPCTPPPPLLTAARGATAGLKPSAVQGLGAARLAGGVPLGEVGCNAPGATGPAATLWRPCFAGAALNSTIWLQLVEKALAKLHGSYEAIAGLPVADALAMLSGGVGEQVLFASLLDPVPRHSRAVESIALGKPVSPEQGIMIGDSWAAGQKKAKPKKSAAQLELGAERAVSHITAQDVADAAAAFMTRATETAGAVVEATAITPTAIDEGIERAPSPEREGTSVTFSAGLGEDEVEEKQTSASTAAAAAAAAAAVQRPDGMVPHSLTWRRAFWFRSYLEAIWTQIVSRLQGTLSYSYLTERHEHRYPHRAHVMASSGVPLGAGAGVDMRGIVPSQCYTVLRTYEWRPLPPRPGCAAASGHGSLSPAERIADPESAACGSVRLLRLRNPWAQREWSGPWADGSAYWKSHDIVRREVEGFGDVGQDAADDGDFWISLSEFSRRFTAVHACREFAETRHGGEWFRYTADAEWSVSTAGGRPTTAGAAEDAALGSTAQLNPHFVLRVSKPTRVMVVLTQCRQASRQQGEQTMRRLAVGMRLLAKNGNRCQKVYAHEERARTEYSDKWQATMEITLNPEREKQKDSPPPQESNEQPEGVLKEGGVTTQERGGTIVDGAAAGLQDVQEKALTSGAGAGEDGEGGADGGGDCYPYTLLATAWEAGQRGKFTITVYTNEPLAPAPAAVVAQQQQQQQQQQESPFLSAGGLNVRPDGAFELERMSETIPYT